jgi:hypothetical protein
MTNNEYYSGSEIASQFEQIVPVYQTAFAGEPWWEVSKCADKLQRCVGGLSSLALGEVCQVCDCKLTALAYPADELTERFEGLARSRRTYWYIEKDEESRITLAAVGWKATAEFIAEEKYGDQPEMSDWLKDKFGTDELMWLDEVFANRDLKEKGNLRKFGKFVSELAARLSAGLVAYRTISPQMLGAADRDFANRLQVFAGNRDRNSVLGIETAGLVPDRRDFVVVKL